MIKIFKVSLYIMININESFIFMLVDDKRMISKSPISEYYYILSDLSINLEINLKGILWGYKFMVDLSNELKNNNLDLNLLISNSNQCINDINKLDYLEHIILIDDVIIEDQIKFEERLNKFYKFSVFNKNTIVHLKMKINLNDYLLITNNLFPTLLKFADSE